MQDCITGVDDRLASLAESIRRLSRSLLVTGVSAEELSEVEAGVDRLTEILASRERDLTAPRVSDWHLNMCNAIEGKANVGAPPLHVTVERPGVITGTMTLSSLASGAPGRSHGGPVAAVLDQAMGRAVVAAGSTSLTMTLEVKYHKGTPIGVPLHVAAHCESISGRVLTVHGMIRNGDELCASSVGCFLVPRENVASVSQSVTQVSCAGGSR